MQNGSVLTIILNYQTPEMTLQCAQAALGEMEDLTGEVLIIDNGSGDGSWEKLQQGVRERGWQDCGRLRLHRSMTNGGFGAGMNIGFAAGFSDGTQPDYYYLLNSDAFVQGRSIRTLRNFLKDHPGAGLAGSYTEGTDGAPHRTAFRFPSIAGEFEMAARTGVFTRLLKPWIVAMEIPSDETQVDWVAGASLMITHAALEAIGGFDETFFLYFEETDLCKRAANAGWRTHYVPESRVIHVGSASTGMKEWQRTPSYWFQSRQHYFTKTHGKAYAACATFARAMGCAIYRFRQVVQGKSKQDPDHFLRDLIRHALPRVSALSKPETRAHTPISEDLK